VAYLRAGGFRGWITYFTNGVQADRVIALLDADDRSEAVLNYSILHGQGAEPLPPGARRRLEAYARRRPGVLFTSHPDLIPVGPGATFLASLGDGANGRVGDGAKTQELPSRPGPPLRGGAPHSPSSPRPAFHGACPRCPPVLTSRGLLHACPFAVELDREQYRLGTGDEAAAHGFARWLRFRDWIGATVEPQAAHHKRHPCAVCTAGEVTTLRQTR
jgi:hypothetical protein